MNSFDRPSSGLDTAEERNTEPEDGQQELSKLKDIDSLKRQDYSRAKGTKSNSLACTSIQSGFRRRQENSTNAQAGDEELE